MENNILSISNLIDNNRFRILIVINNNTAVKKLERILCEHEAIFVNEGRQAVNNFNTDHYDIILLSITLPDTDGYQVLNELKAKQGNNRTPVLFLKDSNQVEIIENNIIYCDIKLLAEEYADKILLETIKSTVEKYELIERQQIQIDKKKQLKRDLNEVTDAMLSLQNDNAKLNDINRFMQKCFFVNDVNELCQELLKVTSGFGINAILFVHTRQNYFFVDSRPSPHQQLGHNIMEMAVNGGRIIRFGNDRALFNWQVASILIDKLTDNVDILAMLMDAFESGMKAIEGIHEFHNVLESYRKQNYDMSVQISQVVESQSSSIHDVITQDGANSLLSIEQEDAIFEISDKHREQVDNLFSSCMQMDEQLKQIILDMRSNKVDEGASNDEIDFFSEPVTINA